MLLDGGLWGLLMWMFWGEVSLILILLFIGMAGYHAGKADSSDQDYSLSNQQRMRKYQARTYHSPLGLTRERP